VGYRRNTYTQACVFQVQLGGEAGYLFLTKEIKPFCFTTWLAEAEASLDWGLCHLV
jgi:hypothetical protein